ncbi:hypothetical protein ACQKWADRAFT_278200 [Trichoderma austrokoningii]
MDDIPDQAQTTSPTIEPIRFRAGKKRKAYRQKATEEDDAETPAPIAPGVSSSDEADSNNEDNDADESAVAAALRLRNARRAASRRGGVGFRSDGPSGEEEAVVSEQHALVLRDQEKDAVVAGGITNRFMHQTGLLTILDDSHMNAYIESRLASRDAANPPPSSSSQPRVQNDDDNDDGKTASNPADKWRDQPTRHGKLVEVDTTSLGDHQLNSNSKRRRVDADAAKPASHRRGRNRRNSKDIARDAMVEQFLHENRVDVYGIPKTHSTTSTTPTTAAASIPGADPSADDRLAEQFRQQYYDEMALRRKRKRPAPTQQQKQQQQQQSADVLKGPKLGGSRNQRAAVRNLLLQQEKDKRGK